MTRITLTNVKMKDAPQGEVIHLQTKRVLDSLVLVAADPPSADAEYEADRLILQVLMDVFTTDGATVAQLVETTELPPSTVYFARGRLEKAGKIVLAKRGNGHIIRLP